MPKFRVKPPLRVSRDLIFGDPKRRGKEKIWLGNVAELGAHRAAVWLDTSSEHVVAIVGQRGSGKSFTLGVLLEALTAGNQRPDLAVLEPSHAVMLLDSLNIYWTSVAPVPSEMEAAGPVAEQQRLLADWKTSPATIDVQLWAPAGFVPSYASAPVTEFAFSLSSLTSQDLADIMDVDLIREPMGQALDESWRKGIVEGWVSKDGTKRIPGNPPTLDNVLDCMDEDRDLKKHFSPETLRAVQQRLRSFRQLGVFRSEGTPLSQLLRRGAASVMLLADVPDDLRRVIVSVLTRKLLAERSKASGKAKATTLGLNAPSDPDDAGIPPTWLMIDEAQNLLPSRSSTAATDALVRFVREGRNTGLSFVVTTQQPNAVDSRILAQVDTLIAHRLATAKDTQVVVDNMKCVIADSVKYGGQSLRLSDSLSSLDIGQALISAPDLQRAVYVSVRPRVTLHGGFEG